MKSRIKLFRFICLCVLFLACQTGLVFGGEGDRVRAKIGIKVKHGIKEYRAKTRERIQTGDLLRIYVHSERSSYVYVVHTDTETVELLNLTYQKIQSSTLVLPSIETYYQVDGKSPVERFVIVCSPKKMPVFLDLEDDGLSYAQWLQTEKDLLQRSRVVSTTRHEPRFEIAGNVRGVPDGAKGCDSFVNKLEVFSGRGMVVKKHEFQVEK
ncbi:MAG: DUF4384 domain-containing protein [Desulfohalobiaceae bacterium]|nr:DUF4384 domain-containing protein [Desulfohalobiaceae bacterium]